MCIRDSRKIGAPNLTDESLFSRRKNNISWSLINIVIEHYIRFCHFAKPTSLISCYMRSFHRMFCLNAWTTLCLSTSYKTNDLCSEMKTVLSEVSVVVILVVSSKCRLFFVRVPIAKVFLFPQQTKKGHTGIRAVSYTHLDVYKRQGYRWCELWIYHG